MKFQYPSDS